MVSYNSEGMSDDSEDDIAGGESHEEMTYRRKYQMLLERCEVLQQDNERLINRIQHAYKYTRRIRKERNFLCDRLDGYKDNWQEEIHQYVTESIEKPVRTVSHPKIEQKKPFRRPSSTKKPSKRSREGSTSSTHRRPSKEGKSLTHHDYRGGLHDIIKVEYESEPSSSAF